MSHIFFDSILIIFFFLTISAIIYFIFLFSQKKAMSGIMMALIVIAQAIVFYGSFIEPKILITTPQKIDLPQIDQPIKIALIADFHVGPYKTEKFISKIVDRTLAENPDLILLAGDFIYYEYYYLDYLDPLAKLAEAKPTYAVLGNHDYGLPSEEWPNDYETAQAVSEKLKLLGISLLKDEIVNLNINNNQFSLIGLDEIWTKPLEIDKLINKQELNQPAIMLCHNPDIVQKLEAQDFELVLSGHSHGGQIRLPLIGPVPKPPTELGRHIYKGLYDLEYTKLFITSGVGESGPRARLFTPPEIALLKIY